MGEKEESVFEELKLVIGILVFFVLLYGSIYIYNEATEPPAKRPYEIIEEDIGIKNYEVVQDIPFYTSKVHKVTIRFHENSEDWLLVGYFGVESWSYDIKEVGEP